MDLGSSGTPARNPDLHCQGVADGGAQRDRAHPKASRQLAVPPLLGRRLPEYPDADLRGLLERPFRIIYVVKPERIEIVTIKHYRQNLPRSPRRLVSRKHR